MNKSASIDVEKFSLWYCSKHWLFLVFIRMKTAIFAIHIDPIWKKNTKQNINLINIEESREQWLHPFSGKMGSSIAFYLIKPDYSDYMKCIFYGSVQKLKYQLQQVEFFFYSGMRSHCLSCLP